MGCWIYILHSEVVDRFYVGQSNDPERRLEFHNTIEKGFTSRYRPWRLVFKKEYATRHEARTAEILIKGWKSRRKIAKLVNGDIIQCEHPAVIPFRSAIGTGCRFESCLWSHPLQLHVLSNCLSVTFLRAIR
jgi:predicted GIY-YIG superfamily endonuclease